VLLWAFLVGCAALVPAGWLWYLCCFAGAAVGPAVQPVLSGCNQVPAAKVPAGQRPQSGTGGKGLRFPDWVFRLLFCCHVPSVTAYLLLLNWLWFRRIPFTDLLYRFSATRCATGC